MLNLRDSGAKFWDKLNRVQRSTLVLLIIGFLLLVPYMDTFGPTSFVNTPIASFRDALVYPIGMFVLMSTARESGGGKTFLISLPAAPKSGPLFC